MMMFIWAGRDNNECKGVFFFARTGFDFLHYEIYVVCISACCSPEIDKPWIHPRCEQIQELDMKQILLCAHCELVHL